MAYPEYIPEREFIGYGYNKPDPKWPNGAKIAVVFNVNYYMGAEMSVEYGDEAAEHLFLEIPGLVAGKKERVDMTESEYEYGGRQGMRRILTLFDQYKAKAVFNANTQALQKAPFWEKALVDSPHELSCASKRWKDYYEVAPEQEEKDIDEAVDYFEKLNGGKKPFGWMIDRISNSSLLMYSRAHLKKNIPLLYSSDTVADELPFWIKSPAAVVDGAEDKGLLMIPSQYDCSDFRFNANGNGWSAPSDFYDQLANAFDMLYAEGEAGEPKMMTVVIHPHISGHAARLTPIKRFLEYITQKDKNVWIATRQEIAEHWAKTYPYDPKTAFCQTPAIPC